MHPRATSTATTATATLTSTTPSASAFIPIFASNAAARRLAHSIPKPPPVIPRDPSDSPSDAKSEGSRPPVPEGKGAEPYYQLSFTCVPCGHRSHHNVSKQGYHTGSTLITCPECRNRHVISDHLGIFTNTKGVTVEDIVREKGQLVKKGSLGEDGDIEFWPDEGIQDPEKSESE